MRSTASVVYIPNLATSRNNVSGISIARQGDLVVDEGALEVRAVPILDDVGSDEGMLDGVGSFGLNIRLMMALMTVMLIWTDLRRERKMFADAWGLMVFGLVAVDS